MTETITPFPHPETGQLLETLDDFRAAIRECESRLGPIYRLRDTLSGAMTERFQLEAFPSRRRRTDKQNEVARCPRCSTEIKEEEAA